MTACCVVADCYHSFSVERIAFLDNYSKYGTTTACVWVLMEELTAAFVYSRDNISHNLELFVGVPHIHLRKWLWPQSIHAYARVYGDRHVYCALSIVQRVTQRADQLK